MPIGTDSIETRQLMALSKLLALLTLTPFGVETTDEVEKLMCEEIQF